MLKLRYALLACVCTLATLGWSDTLELRNGSVIKGRYVGGTETDISFQVGTTTQQYAIADVVSIRFDASRPRSGDDAGAANRPGDQPNPPADTTLPAAAPGSVTVPTGTRITVRTIDSIDSDKNQVGDRFQATLDQPLYVNDILVARKGTDVYGRLESVKSAGQFAGRSQLRLSLTGIVINGQTVAISTGDYELAGKSRGANTAAKVGTGAAIGAVIGAIAGGGKGAAIGAGVGAGAGTAVQVVTKGEQVHVPSETLLEFTIEQPFTVQVNQAQQ